MTEFYEISGTDSSMFSKDENKTIAHMIEQISHDQLLASSYFLINLFSTHNSSSKLRRIANRLLRELADAGIDEYQCALGEFLINGEISPPRGQNAADVGYSWLMKAYAQGYARAAYALSYFHEENRKNHPKDLEKAAFYKQEAARLGFTL